MQEQPWEQARDHALPCYVTLDRTVSALDPVDTRGLGWIPNPEPLAPRSRSCLVCASGQRLKSGVGGLPLKLPGRGFLVAGSLGSWQPWRSSPWQGHQRLSQQHLGGTSNHQGAC